MTAHPLPSAFETRCNAAYEALMWALARPGVVRDLPEPGAASIVDTLIDRECSVFCADDGLAAPIARSGADTCALEEADHAFLGALADAALLRRVACGSDLYPDAGATLILRAALGEGPGVALTGPGIETRLETRIGGLPDGFWHQRRAAFRYPMGFDLFLVDGLRVLGIPRSTHVEVL